MSEKSADFPLLKYLDSQVEALRTCTSVAMRGKEVDAVHDARVASRRMKAALELLKPVLSKRHRSPFNKITRLVRHRLSPIRDADVMLEHLSRLDKGRHAAAVQWMSERVKKGREEALTEAQADLPAPGAMSRLGSWWGLREEIIEAAEAVDSLLAESVHLQLDAFAEKASGLGEQGNSSDAHQLRIAGKSLRYTLEMAKEHGVALPKQVLAHFKRIQTALGLWHDFVVLTDRILCESSKGQLMLHDGQLQQGLLNLSSTLLKRAESQLHKVSESWKIEGPSLVEQIRQAFPLTQQPEKLPQDVIMEDKAAEDAKPPQTAA